MNINIRRAGLADLNELSRLFDGYRTFYEQASDLNVARKYLTERIEKDESVIFIADYGDGSCCGFTQLYPIFSSVSVQRVWVLNDLYVDKAVRHQGVGRQLMNKAREFAEQTKAKGIALETGKTNLNAQALYESLGYKVESDVFNYFLSLS